MPWHWHALPWFYFKSCFYDYWKTKHETLTQKNEIVIKHLSCCDFCFKPNFQVNLTISQFNPQFVNAWASQYSQLIKRLLLFNSDFLTANSLNSSNCRHCINLTLFNVTLLAFSGRLQLICAERKFPPALTQLFLYNWWTHDTPWIFPTYEFYLYIIYSDIISVGIT